MASAAPRSGASPILQFLAQRRGPGENVLVLDTVGFVALKAGQVKRAIGSLEQAVKLAPPFVDIQLHLAEAYGAGGRAREGRQLLAELKSRARGNRQVLAKIAEVQAGFP